MKSSIAHTFKIIYNELLELSSESSVWHLSTVVRCLFMESWSWQHPLLVADGRAGLGRDRATCSNTGQSVANEVRED